MRRISKFLQLQSCAKGFISVSLLRKDVASWFSFNGFLDTYRSHVRSLKTFTDPDSGKQALHQLEKSNGARLAGFDPKPALTTAV